MRGKIQAIHDPPELPRCLRIWGAENIIIERMFAMKIRQFITRGYCDLVQGPIGVKPDDEAAV